MSARALANSRPADTVAARGRLRFIVGLLEDVAACLAFLGGFCRAPIVSEFGAQVKPRAAT
jgi:hypothetical protein